MSAVSLEQVRLRALVLEDEWIARGFLVEIIERSEIATVIGAVGKFDDAAAFLHQSTKISAIDVVFVDINLCGSQKSGLDLIQQFARVPNAPAFVLATALKDHAIEAFSLGVVDYILKPFDEQRIKECLVRLRSNRQNTIEEATVLPNKPTRIVARRKRNLVFLTLQEVWAFEAADGLSLVHSERGTFDIDLSLDAVSTSFGSSFARVHRNWLINEEHVLELERDSGETTILVGARAMSPSPLRIPVARDRSAALRTRLIDDSIGIRRR